MTKPERFSTFLQPPQNASVSHFGSFLLTDFPTLSFSLTDDIPPFLIPEALKETRLGGSFP